METSNCCKDSFNSSLNPVSSGLTRSHASFSLLSQTDTASGLADTSNSATAYCLFSAAYVCVRVCARVHVLKPFHYYVMWGVGTKWRTHMETYVFVLPCKSYKYLYGFLQLVPIYPQRHHRELSYLMQRCSPVAVRDHHICLVLQQ